MADHNYSVDSDDTTVVRESPSKPVADNGGPSFLDAFRQEVKEEVELEPITLPIRTRNNVSVRYTTDIDSTRVTHWRSRSVTNPGTKRESIDPRKFCGMVLNGTSEAVRFRNPTTGKDEDVYDNNDQVVTLVSPWLKEILGVVDTNAVLNRLFGSDAEIIAHGTKVLEAAGYGEDGQVIDAESGDNPLTI